MLNYSVAELRFKKHFLLFQKFQGLFGKGESVFFERKLSQISARLKFVKFAFTHKTLVFHNKQLADNTLHSNSCESSLKRHSLYRPKCSFLFS